MKKLLLAALLLGTQLVCSATPTIYQSNVENVQDIPFNNGVPYLFWSPYTVTVPNLQPTDVIHITTRAEVTNPNNYLVMVGWFLSNTQIYGSTYNPPVVGMPPVTQDIGVGHFVPAIDEWVTGYSGTVQFSLIVYAASSYAPSYGSYLVLERGYGLIQAAVFSGGQ